MARLFPLVCMMMLFRALLIISLGAPSLHRVAAAEPTTNSPGLTFGFSGPEIFPIDTQISQLHAADLDGDGLNDLIVVNNARSRITILYNQTGKTNDASRLKPTGRVDVNELPPDARFRIDSIASEKRISSLVVDDLNGDGKPDLAYYGDPKELIVLYNEGTNSWSAPKRFPIDDGQLTPNALCSGDLNGDGRPDLILLAENFVYLLTQKTDHTLSEPEKIPFSGAIKSTQVVDLDGDGRDDLLLVNWEDRTPFRFRLQRAGGQLGPENYFTFSPIRSYWADTLDTAGPKKPRKTQIITISQNSGRAQISEFRKKPAEKMAGDFYQGQLEVMPLSKTDKARRGLTWADVDGDGLADLLVAEPETGQLTLYLQQKDGRLAAPKSFPTLAGVTDLAVSAREGSGHPDIFMLSPDERQVGVTRLDENGKIPFPTLIPVDGKPLVLAVGKLQAGAKSTLALIVEQESKGEDDSRKLLVTRTADGKTKTQKLNKDFKSNPTTLAFHDANQDGTMDLVVLTPYEKVKLLLQHTGTDFEEVDVAAPGGAIEQPWLSAADVDGDGKPELLLTQKNFLRAVVLQPDATLQSSTNRSGWAFKVKEQVNGSGSNSRLIGATAVPSGSNNIPALFLLDAERKVLTLCEKDGAGVWQIVRNVSLPFTEFASLQSISLGGTKAIGLMGLNAVGTLPLAGDVWELAELDSYETPIKDGRLNDVVTGDLNSDGRKDLVFLETARNYVDLVAFDENHKLVPANRWQVFEERTFRNRRNELPEPREAVVADLTGDGKNDLAVLVHDRVLLYPQE